MKNPLVVGVATVMVLGAGSGCHVSSSPGSASPPASSSSVRATSQPSSITAQPGDYTGLLIKATDIPTNGEPFMALTPVQNPSGQPGVEGRFSNQSSSRQISDTILIQPDASHATTALENFKNNIGANMRITATPQPAAVGTGGMLYPGTTTDGSQSVTTLLFAEGKANVILEFHSSPDDPVPPDGAVELGQKQDSNIKQQLPG
jgi:hypothetical protein